MPEEATKEMLEAAMAKAEEAIEAVRQARTPDMEMIKVLAQQVMGERLARCEMGPMNKKGRQAFILHGEPGPAEQHWAELERNTP